MQGPLHWVCPQLSTFIVGASLRLQVPFWKHWRGSIPLATQL
jgi:hypothetical protein